MNGSSSGTDRWEAARRAAVAIGGHDVAVVMGSGWGVAAAALGESVREVPFADIPGFLPPTVSGHAGVARTVEIGSKRVLVLQGRVHLYEGHGVDRVAHAVRAAVLAGCGVVVLTNACGGMRPEQGHAPGVPVLIRDQLNLTGLTPMGGPPPPDDLPGRFVDLTDLYAARLRAVARSVDPTLLDGVYAGLLGGAYETPAEIRMLQGMGADLVGMSTVLEAIAAHHLGAEVLGLALVTNLAAGLSPAHLAHDEVTAAGAEAGPRLGALLRGIVAAV